MYGAEIGILEQMHHERLGTFLKRLDRLRLPAERLAVDRNHGHRDLANLNGRRQKMTRPRG